MCVKVDRISIIWNVLFYFFDNLGLYFKLESYLILTNTQSILKGNELAESK